jgi:hypothetical protein
VPVQVVIITKIRIVRKATTWKKYKAVRTSTFRAKAFRREVRWCGKKNVWTKNVNHATSFLGSSLFRRKDPGNSWSRGSQKIDCLCGCGKSIILHASTSALYRVFCTVNFENHMLNIAHSIFYIILYPFRLYPAIYTLPRE